MNTEKIAILKKGLTNPNISDKHKQVIKSQIERLEKEDASIPKEKELKVHQAPVVKEAPVLNNEENPKPKRVRKAPATKPNAKSKLKTKAETKPQAKEEHQKPVLKRNSMTLAKEIRKEGESWASAVNRASLMMKKEAMEADKESKSELNKVLQRIRNLKQWKHLSGKTNLERDAKRHALPSGRRLSRDGNIYYENRINRTDNTHIGKYSFEKGGDTELWTPEKITEDKARKLFNQGMVIYVKDADGKLETNHNVSFFAQKATDMNIYSGLKNGEYWDFDVLLNWLKERNKYPLEFYTLYSKEFYYLLDDKREFAEGGTISQAKHWSEKHNPQAFEFLTNPLTELTLPEEQEARAYLTTLSGGDAVVEKNENGRFTAKINSDVKGDFKTKKEAYNHLMRYYNSAVRYEKGGDTNTTYNHYTLAKITEAIYVPNSKKSRIDTEFGSKTYDGLESMIENEDYTAEEIAMAIFNNNSKSGKIETTYGDKSLIGLTEIIKLARENVNNYNYANGGHVASKSVHARVNNSPVLRYSNFEPDNANINLIRLIKPYSNGLSYAISTYDNKEQKVLLFKSLNKAEEKYDQMVAEKQKTNDLRTSGVVTPNYENGGDFMSGVYEKGGATDEHIFYLMPLEVKPLSSQLYVYTGDHLNTGDYTNEHGKDYTLNPNDIIVHKATGKKFRIPEKIYDHVDGYNLVLSKSKPSIVVYETGKKVADIKESKLDFSDKDDSISIDKIKVQNEFEKGNIPSQKNADQAYMEIENKLQGLYAMYEDLGEHDSASEKIQKKISDYETAMHRLERKYELGGTIVSDLAGHTGCSLGTGDPSMLDGFSNTNYTGLVGETGAMSSGEMFENGGDINPALNSKIIKRAEQLYLEMNGKTEDDFNKCYEKAIIEFGYNPKVFYAKMEEIGSKWEDDEMFAKGGVAGTSSIYNTANQATVVFNDKNVVVRVEDYATKKLKKEFTINNKLYKRNSAEGTYNSIDDNSVLTITDFNPKSHRQYEAGGSFDKSYNVIYNTKSGRTMVAKGIQAKSPEEAKEKLKKQMQASSTFDKVVMVHESFEKGGNVNSYSNGNMSPTVFDETINKLVGKTYAVHLMGVPYPIYGQITKISVTPEHFQKRNVIIENKIGSQSVFPLKELSDFISGEEIMINHGQEPYAISLIINDSNPKKNKTDDDSSHESFEKGGNLGIEVDTDTYEQFLNYVDSFYGTQGIYADELNNGKGFSRPELADAIIKYIKSITTEQWGGGDTIDREKVRDILEEQNNNNPNAPKKLNGYLVHFVKSEFGSDKNIVSNGQFRNMILVTDGIKGDSFSVMSNEPYLQLEKTEYGDKPYLYAKPVNLTASTVRLQNGGNFVFSFDSRFTEDISRYPIPVFDRHEKANYENGGDIFANGGGLDFRLHEETEELKSALKGFNVFAKRFWEGSGSFSKENNDKELKDFKETLVKLNEGKIKPSIVIGTGYKSQYAKKIAQDWLNVQIQERQRIDKNNGLTDAILQSNFRYYIKNAKINRLIDEKEYNRLLEQQFEIIGNTSFEKGGQIDLVNYKLEANPNYRYQNIVNNWLNDYFNSKKYKLAVLLLANNNNPEKILKISDDQYSNLLRSLDSITESNHEMRWRTQNYTLAEAEKWAKESLKEKFVLKEKFQAGGVMDVNAGIINDASQSYVNYYLGEGASAGIYEDGGSIPNNYQGKTDWQIWDAWTEEQRSHFLLDHSELLDNDRKEHFGNTASRTFQKDKKYEDLTTLTKGVLKTHIDKGQYAKGGQLSGKYVAVAVSKDDFWTVISRPTTKKEAQTIADTVTMLFENTHKVVTVKEVLAHKKVLGKEDLYESGGELELKDILSQIKKQTGLNLQLDDYFTGVHEHNGYKYFNVSLNERTSESQDFKKLQSFANKYKTIKVEPNGLKRVAIFFKNKSGESKFKKGGKLDVKEFYGIKTLGNLVKDDKGLMYWENHKDKKIRLTSGNGTLYFVTFDSLPEAEAYVKKVNASTPEFFSHTVFHEGGLLQGHGLRIGDTFLKTMSGNVQKVRDKDGEIVFVDLETGYRDFTPPLPFENGGKLAFGGLFGKKPLLSNSPDLDDKQVQLKSGEYVQVFSQSGDTLSVLPLGRIGSGEKPYNIDISEVDASSYANGGELTFKQKSAKIAKQFEGKPVESKYKKQYGERYSKKEAKEVGNKIAGSMVAKSKDKMVKGGKVKTTRKGSGNPDMVKALKMASETRKPNEKWPTAVKRCYTIVKESK